MYTVSALIVHAELPASMSLSIAATYHSVFAHKYYPLNFPIGGSQTLPNLMHLLRADIVDGNNKDRLVPNL